MSLFYEKNGTGYPRVKYVNVFIASIVVCLIVGITIIFAAPAIARYQKRQNASNNIRVTELEIQNTKQKVEVEKQKAAVRVAEARGISDSQHIINATLTDRYLQHEAINAQEQMANSPNHTTIYIPSGQNGIPIVNTVDPTKE